MAYRSLQSDFPEEAAGLPLFTEHGATAGFFQVSFSHENLPNTRDVGSFPILSVVACWHALSRDISTQTVIQLKSN
jgi:hypothetical protein